MLKIKTHSTLIASYFLIINSREIFNITLKYGFNLP